MSSYKGRLFLIGAGPGDPDLMTVKAVRVLGECDVVLYDRLVGAEILKLARAGAELISVGKHEGDQELVQERIFSLILNHALSGKTVARLKGGDPLVFGRGAEEWSLAIEHGIPVEVIPGVTSAISVPALAGIPLTYRKISRSFTVVTGHCARGSQQKWANYAKVDTLVILMGVKNRMSIARALIDAGRNPYEPVAFIERGATSLQRTVISDLISVALGNLEVEAPAVFVIGEVVRLKVSSGPPASSAGRPSSYPAAPPKLTD